MDQNSPPKRAIVVTSISPPTPALRAIAQGCQQRNFSFFLIGDTKSPAKFVLEGCDFFSLQQQLETGLSFARQCPERQYSRKNIGYLLAIQQGVEIIQETDDDNIPYPEFWAQPEPDPQVVEVRDRGWLNVYRYFTDELIWPRGLPLDVVNSPIPDRAKLPMNQIYCPIQQGLADENPDVDAIYRLVLPLPQKFRRDHAIALSTGTWCPFNSQNTLWLRAAFPLLYLPTYCSFRMTDIWRSFIAQRIAWENNWSVLFHAPTVWQDRNEHNLMHDFQEEVVGYLRNQEFSEILAQLELKPGVTAIASNLLHCYEKLIQKTFFAAEEMDLLVAWLQDLNDCGFSLS